MSKKKLYEKDARPFELWNMELTDGEPTDGAPSAFGIRLWRIGNCETVYWQEKQGGYRRHRGRASPPRLAQYGLKTLKKQSAKTTEKVDATIMLLIPTFEIGLWNA